MGIRFKYGPSYTPPKSPLREMYLNYIVILVISLVRTAYKGIVKIIYYPIKLRIFGLND